MSAPREFVIAVYRPKEGMEGTLGEIVERHVPTLRRLGMATDYPATVLKSRIDGTLIEIFEWASNSAVEQAHKHPEVLEMWNGFAACSDYMPVGSLKEAGELFAHYDFYGQF